MNLHIVILWHREKERGTKKGGKNFVFLFQLRLKIYMKPFPTFVVFFFVAIRCCSDSERGGSGISSPCVLNPANTRFVFYQELSHYASENVKITKLNTDDYFSQAANATVTKTVRVI